MSAPTNDPLAPLGLPSAIRLQAGQLLRSISSTATLEDVLRAAGFALGIETLRALNQGDVEGLYLVFDRAYQVRKAELGP